MRSAPLSELAQDVMDGPSEDLADLYENAPCGYLSLSPAGRIVKANATLAVWLGRRAEDLLGSRLHDLMSVPSKIFFETHVSPLLRMQGYLHEVALDLIAEGDRLPILANASERRDKDGKLLFTRITIFQATERRRHERELLAQRGAAEDAKAALQKLNLELEARIDEAVSARLSSEKGLLAERELGDLREQFIAVLGHDLRNPLSSIDSGALLLLREEQSDKAKHVLGLMQGSVVRMAGLIDNLMDFARGRLGGGITLNRNAAAPLEPVLLQVVEELRVGKPDRLIETRIDLTAPVDCDRSRIGQMASNLLGNALTHGSAEVPVRLVARTVDDGFELSVANGGAPIPEDAMAKLFEPFFRGEVRGSLQGLGLGLHIASEIAKAHGGTLDVASGPLETRFTFRMPLATPKAA